MAAKIHWNTGGEDTANSKYTWYNKLGKTIEMPIPILEGCEFCGWYNYDPNKPDSLERIDLIRAEDTREFRLYALWKKDGEIVDCYGDISPETFKNIRESKTEFYGKISYNCATPLTEEMLSKTAFSFDEELELPIPERDGYIFGGWYDHSRRLHRPRTYKVGNIIKEFRKKNYHLYAKWIDQNGMIDDCYEEVKPKDFINSDKSYQKFIADKTEK